MAAVHIPEKKFKREIRNVFIYPLDTAADEANSGPFEDDILDYIDMNLFIKTLDERDRAILIMRLAGYRQKEIAEALGISESQVSRRIDQIDRSYLCYTERRACAS